MILYAFLIVFSALTVSAVKIEELVDDFLLGPVDENKDRKVSHEEAKKYFNDMDANKDGKITLDEFIPKVKDIGRQFEGHVKTLFEIFTAVNKNEINIEDIIAIAEAY